MDAREWIWGKRDLTLLKRLIDRLRYESGSRHRVVMFGDELFWGWDVSAARLSDLVNLLDLNTRASATQKAKPRDLAPWPKVTERRVHKAKNLNEFHEALNSSQL